MRIIRYHPCPYCQKDIAQRMLIREPSTHLPISQTFHCPYCKGQVEVKMPVKQIALSTIALLAIAIIQTIIDFTWFYRIVITFIMTSAVIVYLMISLNKAPFMKSN